jgi:hypothetical protein
MAAQKAIIYIAEEQRPRIYSVGSDGKDNGGSDKPLRQNAHGKWMEEDVVVHLKRQPRVRTEE